jgi:hypothetical protein
MLQSNRALTPPALQSLTLQPGRANEVAPISSARWSHSSGIDATDSVSIRMATLRWATLQVN